MLLKLAIFTIIISLAFMVCGFKHRELENSSLNILFSLFSSLCSAKKVSPTPDSDHTADLRATSEYSSLPAPVAGRINSEASYCGGWMG